MATMANGRVSPAALPSKEDITVYKLYYEQKQVKNEDLVHITVDIVKLWTVVTSQIGLDIQGRAILICIWQIQALITNI